MEEVLVKSRKCFGKHVRNIDEKGRIIVPMDFRKKLGTELYLAFGNNARLKIYSIEYWEEYYEKFEEFDEYDEYADREAMQMLDTVVGVRCDTQGRLSIPAESRKYAGITDEVIVLGRGKFVEIWDTKKYEAFLDK